jgi:hypothetical protein
MTAPATFEARFGSGSDASVGSQATPTTSAKEVVPAGSATLA